MLDWMKRRRPAARQRPVHVETPKPQRRQMTGKYLLLYKYLENRYADTVVLTFAEIEDLLGFELPEQARLQQAWWTENSDAWVLASRTAVPNLVSRCVVFDRAA
jgi:hypothetical protein